MVLVLTSAFPSSVNFLQIGTNYFMHWSLSSFSFWHSSKKYSININTLILGLDDLSSNNALISSKSSSRVQQ